MTLVTAFEPFGNNENNISLEVLNALRETDEIQKLCLPVSFRRAPECLSKYLCEHHPDAVLMLGQCKEGENIRIERYAHNLMDSRFGDNDGFCPDEQCIYDEAPVACETTFCVKNLTKSCLDAGSRVVVSNSAGLYVCNRVYYECLYKGYSGLFIHIPKNFNVSEATQTINNIMKSLSCSP